MKVIVTFYASSRRGSEYRSGWEFIKFASDQGFDIAIVADLEDNIAPGGSDLLGLDIEVVQVKSLVRNQSALYKWSDFLVQQLWHRRVSKWIESNIGKVEILWVQNGAQPWQPVKGYLRQSKKMIWGPIGGGAAPPINYLMQLPLREALRERVRLWFQTQQLQRKNRQFAANPDTKVMPIARTVEAQSLIQKTLGFSDVPVIPEILWPLAAGERAKQASDSPKFIWVGQDLPRKNLDMAIKLFSRLSESHFPNSTLDVFGARREETSGFNIRYHGWVSKINWGAYSDNGVLLLTSFREGLPSVIIEALAAGLFCVSTDTGSIGHLNSERMYLLSMKPYPEICSDDVINIANKISVYLKLEFLPKENISFDKYLEDYLRAGKML